MRSWNLTEFSELEDQVVLSYAASHRRRRPSGPKKACPILVTACMALWTMGFTIATIQANSPTVSIPRAGMAFAQSLPEEKPPLDHIFANRFDNQWTVAMEEDLLSRIALHGESAVTRFELTERAIDSIFSNQQEKLSGVNRLSRDEVARIVRARKLA